MSKYTKQELDAWVVGIAKHPFFKNPPKTYKELLEVLSEVELAGLAETIKEGSVELHPCPDSADWLYNRNYDVVDQHYTECSDNIAAENLMEED